MRHNSVLRQQLVQWRTMTRKWGWTVPQGYTGGDPPALPEKDIRGLHRKGDASHTPDNESAFSGQAEDLSDRGHVKANGRLG